MRWVVVAVACWAATVNAQQSADTPHYADGAPLPSIDLTPPRIRFTMAPPTTPARKTPQPTRPVPCSDNTDLPSTADCSTGDIGTGTKTPGDTLEPLFGVRVTGRDRPRIHADVYDLPDLTQVLISVEDDFGQILGQQEAVVQNHEINAGPFSSGSNGYPVGKYVLNIDVPIADVQPAAVRTWLGENMSNVIAPQDLGRFITSYLGQRAFHQRTRFFINWAR